MRVIDLDDTTSQRLTCLIYGPSRSGKTQFLGTWPRPYIIADAHEGGYETLRHMPRDLLWEPEIKPHVVAVDNYSDAMQALKQFRDVWLKDPKKYLTLGVDSLTFLANALEDELLTTLAAKIEKNRFLLYTELKQRLRRLMLEVHKIPVNIVWTCLANVTEAGQGVPMVPGQTHQTLPAMCNLLLFANVTQSANAAPTFQIRTRKYMNFQAGSRDGGLLPDPMEPSYQTIAECYGIPKPQLTEVPRAARPVAPPRPQVQVRRA